MSDGIRPLTRYPSRIVENEIDELLDALPAISLEGPGGGEDRDRWTPGPNPVRARPPRSAPGDRGQNSASRLPEPPPFQPDLTLITFLERTPEDPPRRRGRRRRNSEPQDS